MTSWRLASAETLVFGDALDVLVPEDASLTADECVAVEALRDIGIVRVVVADLVPPGLAVRAALAGVPAAAVEIELALRGRGDRRRVLWVVELIGPAGFERRAVDAFTGAVLATVPRREPVAPAALLLTRVRGQGVELALWARTVIGLPLSVQLPGTRLIGDCADVWRRVVHGRPERLTV